MIYTEKIKIPLKDIEKANVISDKGLLEIFENVATHHSDSVGDGVNEIKIKKQAWVLMDWKVKVLNRPQYGEAFTVKTWSREKELQDRKISSYRDFELYDSKENICVIATSKWVIVNIETGRLANIDKEILQKYVPESRSVFNEWDIEKISQGKEYKNSVEYKVLRYDVDFNNHMHNIYYLNLAYNALPEDVYETRPFNNIRITYKREIKLGEKVICKYSYENDNHIVTIFNEDETKVHSIIILSK